MTKNGLSILIASRKKGNPNWKLPAFLDSLREQTADPSSLEVLLKFDDDDDEIQAENLPFEIYPFKIKHLVSKRQYGWYSLVHFYGEAYQLSNPKFDFVMAAADDFVIAEKGWDQLVYQTARNAGDYFIIHQWLPFLKVHYDAYKPDTHRVDEAPIWSRKLVDLWDWAAPIPSTDGLTISIQWFLYHHFGICITYYLRRQDPQWPLIDRKKCPDDYLEDRWHRTHTSLPQYNRPHQKVPGSNPYALSLAEKIARHIRQTNRMRSFLHKYRLACQIFYARLIGNPIDIPGFSKYGSELTTYLIESRYFGYNILCNNGLLYAFPCANGPFDMHTLQITGYPHRHFVGHSVEEVKALAKQYPLEAPPLYLTLLRRFKRWGSNVLR